MFIDVIFLLWLGTIPALKELKSIMFVLSTYNIVISNDMNRKELTKTLMMISN